MYFHFAVFVENNVSDFSSLWFLVTGVFVVKNNSINIIPDHFTTRHGSDVKFYSIIYPIYYFFKDLTFRAEDRQVTPLVNKNQPSCVQMQLAAAFSRYISFYLVERNSCSWNCANKTDLARYIETLVNKLSAGLVKRKSILLN